MTIVSATAQVGGSDALRPRVWVGDTVHAVGLFTGLDRKPVAVTSVTFLWRDPNGVEVTTLGYPEAGSPPASWSSKLEVTVPGVWAVRPQCETPSRQLDWMTFAVVPGFGDPTMPSSPLWLTGDDTGLLTYGGGVLTALRIAELPTADEFLPGDVLPVSRVGGATEGVSGETLFAAVKAAGTAAIAAEVEQVANDAQAVETARALVEAAAQATEAARSQVAANQELVAADRQTVLTKTADAEAAASSAANSAAMTGGWLAGRTVTGPTTLLASDANTIVTVAAATMTKVTVPSGLTPFACLIRQGGAGQVWIDHAAPIVVDAPSGKGSAGVGTLLSLIGTGADRYSLVGGAYVTPPGAPVLTGGGVFTVSENVVGAFAGYVGFSGADVTLSVTEPFAIDQRTGEITTASALDYEGAPQLMPEITAENPWGTVKTTITVNVTNVPPANILTNQRFALRDSAAAGTAVGQILTDGAVTGFSLSGPFSVDATGVFKTTGALNAGATPSYTLTAGATGAEGVSPPVPVIVDVIGAAEVYAPGANGGAVAYFDASDTSFRTTSGSPVMVDGLTSKIGTPVVFAKTATTSQWPRLGLGTDGTGIGNSDAVVFSGLQGLAAASGSSLKNLCRNVGVFAVEGVFWLDEALTSEILRFTTAGSTTLGRFALRVSTGAGIPQLQLAVRRLDTDAAVTVTHSREITRQTPHYFYAEFDAQGGAVRLALDGSTETTSVSFASGLGLLPDTASNAAALGMSAGLVSYTRVTKLALYQAKPAEPVRLRNGGILRTSYGIAA